jgi:hypothetical protein
MATVGFKHKSAWLHSHSRQSKFDNIKDCTVLRKAEDNMLSAHEGHKYNLESKCRDKRSMGVTEHMEGLYSSVIP